MSWEIKFHSASYQNKNSKLRLLHCDLQHLQNDSLARKGQFAIKTQG